jgi:ElaB/YqjD/DUF883 family membrane-anchored ribosome-binding protein
MALTCFRSRRPALPLVALLWISLHAILVHSFIVPSRTVVVGHYYRQLQSSSTSSFATPRLAIVVKASNKPQEENNKDQDEDEEWDANVDYEKEWPSFSSGTGAQQQRSRDPTSSWDALSDLPDTTSSKLGIDIGQQLMPLSEKEISELREEATELINDAFASGIDDIEKLRSKMKRELDRSKSAMQFASELNAQEKSAALLSKIDKLTDDFLSSTRSDRESTQLAAAASRSMEDSNKGLEMGTWGTLSGRTVLADSSYASASSLLGSVDNAKRSMTLLEAEKKKTTTTKVDDSSSSSTTSRGGKENRILIVADIKQVRASFTPDYAKATIPIFVCVCVFVFRISSFSLFFSCFLLVSK